MKNKLSKKEKRFKRFLILILVLLGCYYLNNQVAFNAYWGYDGGAHLEYIKTIFSENRLPTFSENYLAWHEPLYYIFSGIMAKIIHLFNFFNYDFIIFEAKFLQFFNTFFLVSSIYLVYKISSFFTESKFIQVLIILFTGSLGAFLETANYLTNEIMAIFWSLLLFYSFLAIEKSGWTIKKSLFFGLILGLGLLTKLSILIFLLAFLIFFIYKNLYNKKYRDFQFLPVIFIVAFLICLPWLYYKNKNIGSIWSINSYENEIVREENPAKLPLSFWLTFDFSIFDNPFWRNGQKSFVTMLTADTFIDYYVIGDNVDIMNEKPIDQKILTDSGRFISQDKFIWSLWLFDWSLLWVLFFTISLIYLLVKFIKNKFKPDNLLFLLIFCFGSFAALAYNVYAYPFLERGTLKAGFILPSILLVIMISFIFLDHLLKKYKLFYLWPIVFIIFLITISLSFYTHFLYF